MDTRYHIFGAILAKFAEHQSLWFQDLCKFSEVGKMKLLTPELLKREVAAYHSVAELCKTDLNLQYMYILEG